VTQLTFNSGERTKSFTIQTSRVVTTTAVTLTAAANGLSKTARLTVEAAPDPPAAPSGLTAAARSESVVDLQWRDNSNNERGFRLERKVGTGAYTLLATLPAGTTSRQDSNLTPNTLYIYRIRANNLGGNSAYSNEAAVTTLRKLGGLLQVTPASVNFGRVKRKKTKLMTVTLRNRSTTERLQITVTSPLTPFGLPKLPGTVELAPGATAAISTSFRPTKKKKYTGKLALTSTDPAHAAVSVILKGAGK
jgi:hypothetical protein